MEREFFNWKGWDVVDVMVFQFYDCKLVKDVGEFMAGEKIETIVVDFNKGIMEFHQTGDLIPDSSGACATKIIGKFFLGLSITAEPKV